MTPDAIEAMLRERGCSITAPRRAILSFLANNDAHPTASEADPSGSLGSSTVGAGRRGRDSRQSC